ncbi:MAG: DUF1846 domain-containing protein [Candidatus Omnitrophota bacterium]
MTAKTGFDNKKYLKEQTKAILDRVRQFDGKLYLEFGGKVTYDYHASRVLPGFAPNVKMQLLEKLKDEADIILCIYAGDIERRKVRADFGITYDTDALRMIDELRDRGLNIAAVVITRFEEQSSAKIFKNKLERRGIKVYTHRFTKGYPTDIDAIVSDEGYGANEHIATNKPLVIVTGPGPGSGKLATCLSQLYHDHKKGVHSGYAKFETFPIWSIPLKHPVNVAYESATADLRDFNMIDPFHLETYNKSAINYNRDVEIFPVLKRILQKIMGEELVYKSPTDMGVNRAGFGIVNDAVVQEAAKQEIIRRYYKYACEYALGFADAETVERALLIVEEIGMRPEDRVVVQPAKQASIDCEQAGKGNKGVFCGAAIQLPDGTIITGKNSPLMHAASSVILNAVKTLAELPDAIHVLSPSIIESIGTLKKNILKKKTISLDVEETLIALSISAASNPTAAAAMERLKSLRGCEVHLSHMPTSGDEAGLRKLGVNLTSESVFATDALFDA